MSANDSKTSQGAQKQQPHTPGQTEGSRKGLDDQHASQHKNRDRSEGQTAGADATADDTPIPTFDEGERRPSPIESPDQGGLRAPAPIVSANPKDYHPDDKDLHTDATMPPGEGRDPKRNTM
ncbi:MAG TPA: hypothetical protein VNJ02_03995 [Vicinamibacterales bacterium]|nr:hypothetical protein [Vicinamibacterales bacterium]